MKGTIRVVVGLVVTMAAVGGMDHSTDTELIMLTVIAGLGLLSMYSGVRAQQL